MVQVAAWTDPDATQLRLTFPDGTVVEDEVRLDGAIETHVHGRTAVGHIVDGPWAAALGGLRRPSGPHRPLRSGRRHALGAPGHARHATDRSTRSARSSASATSTRGGSGCSSSSRAAGPHEEDTWVGCRIGLGETVLRISAPVPRCAMTTHDPETGERDHDTLRAIKEYRGQVDGKDLMFGVLGEVDTPGVIRLGDEVRVLGLSRQSGLAISARRSRRPTVANEQHPADRRRGRSAARSGLRRSRRRAGPGDVRAIDWPPMSHRRQCRPGRMPRSSPR